ncbi:MAG: MFS transporter [Bacteroidota bacterium]
MKTPRTVSSSNFRFHLLEGSLYTSSFALLNFQVVYPAIVQHLGGSNIAVGSLPVINYMLYLLPQLVSANYVNMEPYRRPWVLAGGLAQRLSILLMGMVIALFGAGFPTLALMLFFLLFGLNQVIAGIVAPSWFDFVVKTTLPHQRGRLMGLRSSFGSGLGLLNSLVLAALLTYFTFPWNYALAFLLAFAFQFSSWIWLKRVVEETPSATEPPVPLSRLIAKVAAIVRGDRMFRLFLISTGLAVVGLMPQGFFTIVAIKRFDLPESFIGFFTMTMLSAQVVFAGLLGWIADLKGHKISLVVCSGAMVLASLIALFAQHPVWYFAIFSFVGLIFGVELITRHNFVAELASEKTRPLYIGIMNAWSAPFFLSSLLAGWVSERFGYDIVFIAGGVFSLAGLVLLLQVDDPRNKKPDSALPV